jgi:adenylosuccinate synthase
VNGLSSLCLTKLDVLDGLTELKICNGYRYNGHELSVAPVGADALAKCEPVYESMPGWSENTQGAQTLAELPQAAQNYVARLAELVGVQIDIVSTGPDRAETIVIKDLYA